MFLAKPSGRAWRASILVALLVLAALPRFWHLDAWPIFGDEDNMAAAILLMHGLSPGDVVVASEQTSRPPLALIALGLATDLVRDPVLAGRLIGAVSGSVNTLLCWWLGTRFGGGPVGVLTAVLYALSPLAVLHERMGLQDGPLTALSLGAALCAWNAIESGSLGWALGSGLLGAAAMQVKASALPLFFGVLLFCLGRWRTGRSEFRPLLLVCGPPLVSFLGLFSEPILPAMAAQSTGRLAPLVNLQGNLQALAAALVAYFPAYGCVLAPVGAVLLARRRCPGLHLALLTMLCGVLTWVLLSNFAPSRYYLPLVPFVLAFMAVALVELIGARRTPVRVCGVLLGTMIVAGSAIASYRLATDLATADLTALDDWQYRSSWPSGFAFPEASDYLRTHLESDDMVAYLIYSAHRIGAGMFEPKPEGALSLGLLTDVRQLPRAAGRPLWIMVDDPPDLPPGAQLAQVESAVPDAELVLRTYRPRSETSVSVLRVPASATP